MIHNIFAYNTCFNIGQTGHWLLANSTFSGSNRHLCNIFFKFFYPCIHCYFPFFQYFAITVRT